MIGKLIQKTLVVGSLLGTSFVSLHAGDTHSLFAVEGGASSLQADASRLQINSELQKSDMGHVGLKFGAESDDYRIFFSGRNYFAEKDNKIITAGAEIQYKFNFSKPVNFFIGGNAGLAYVEIGADGLKPAANLTAPYFGGDLGFNIHASELVDLELGAKYMLIDKSVTENFTTYTIRDLTSFYASVIFKWQMD